MRLRVLQNNTLHYLSKYHVTSDEIYFDFIRVNVKGNASQFV
jgi:hypothetical protein